jgi:hypothetical protein
MRETLQMETSNAAETIKKGVAFLHPHIVDYSYLFFKIGIR